MEQDPKRRSRRILSGILVSLVLVASAAGFFIIRPAHSRVARSPEKARDAVANVPARVENRGAAATWHLKAGEYQPRIKMDSSGSTQAVTHFRWSNEATLEEIAESWRHAAPWMLEELDKALPPPGKSDSHRLLTLICKVNVLNMLGKNKEAYELLEQTRGWVEHQEGLAELGLYEIIFLQGMTAMRRGETENCIMCRGESSCILPISAAAVHTVPIGSRLAIKHFTEYLQQFPDDFDVQWLLNLAHMTLGEYPGKVDPRYLISLEPFLKSEFNIGKFRDIGDLTKINRFGVSGGGVLEDLDNDGRLDLTVTNYDPTVNMGFYRNMGDGTFEERTKAAGLIGQLGGQTAIPTDYNNDGWMDLFVSRGAWFLLPIRQSLLRNNGNGTFTDVTKEAGLLGPSNVHISCWADYDNDGFLDVFLNGERQSNRLYHNRGNGTFEEVTEQAGIEQSSKLYCKGATWIDYDNDDYPDLFIDNMFGTGRLLHNNRDGKFTEVTKSMGIDGPTSGFSCWSWDYDNDGWLDIFATCYDFSLGDVIKGMIGKPHSLQSNRLYHNVNGKRFEDKTKEAGLDKVFATMGSNFGDFDNDGFLDFYLGTGATNLSFLVPNRMFKNVGGKRFADITASSGTGNLQKGHSISCGDWDRDGDIDIFCEMGGAVVGDSYHNILFQNPGQGNHWLTVKLVGKKTNRSAMGARIKVVTAGPDPLTIHQQVSRGSSWGCNPLQQHIGLAKARKVALLEIHWPTSGTTQVFHDVPADQAIEITEFAKDYRKLDWKPIPLPK